MDSQAKAMKKSKIDRLLYVCMYASVRIYYESRCDQKFQPPSLVQNLKFWSTGAVNIAETDQILHSVYRATAQLSSEVLFVQSI